MSRENIEFWKQVWKRYPETEIVYGTEKGRLRLDFYSKLLPTKKGLMLDLGCGDGKMRPYIQHYIGLDVSPEALSNIDGMTVCGTAEVLPFRDEAFDHVLMCEVFEHIVDRANCLREVHRILKPKGELIMSSPYGHHPSHESSSEPITTYGLPLFNYKNGRFNENYLTRLLDVFNFKVKYLTVLSVKNIPNNIILVGVKQT